MRGFVIFLSMICLAAGGTPLAAEPLPQPRGAVILTISGNIVEANAPGEARFDREMLEALGKSTIETTSALSTKPQLYEGVPLRTILERAGAKGEAMLASALNKYQIKIPMSDLKYEPLVAFSVDGKPLKLRDKGPLWIVYPRDRYGLLQDVRYDSRWVWQLNRLHVE